MTAPSDEREILERTVRAIADRARDAYRVVEEAHAIESKDESGLVSAAKQLRMELLQTKAELERELGRMRLALQPAGPLGQWRRSQARALGARGTSAERS